MNKRLRQAKVKTQSFSLREKYSSTAAKLNQNAKDTISKTYSTVNQYNPFVNGFRFNFASLKKKVLLLLVPTAFAFGFSAAVFDEAPYLFSHTKLSYFKSHPSNLILAIMGINAAVFGLWQVQYSNDTVYRILNRYFWLNIRSIQSKTYLQMICVNWSHIKVTQLLITMGFFYSFANNVINALGAAHFLSLYLISGICSSLASLYIGAHSPIGSAGTVSGIFATSATLFPNTKLEILGLSIPCESSTALIGYTFFNIAGMFTKWGDLCYANHLGGTLAGIVYGRYALQYLISKWWFW